jgi:hydroxymethylpyrimidine pyrophosphatase-like HAD family hydrolase
MANDAQTNLVTDLIVTDLDGTIWDRQGRIHPRTLAALAHLESREVPVLAATARRPSSALGIMASNGVILPAVLFDGCLGHDFRSGSTFHLRTFETETAAWVLEVLAAAGIEPCVNIVDPHKDVVVGFRPSTVPDHLLELETVLRRGDLGEVVTNEDVLSFVVCGRPEEFFLSTAGALAERATISISRDVTFGGTVLSVRPTGVNKWEGVVAYCATTGLDPDRILAVGDGENDLELLKAAAVSFAIEGSSDAVMAASQRTLRRPEVGGWAEIAALF